MTAETVFDLVRETIWVAMLIGGPPLLAALVVGLAVSLLQALTQIQELTLTLVPKMAAIFAALALSLPFMWATLQGFGERLYDRIGTLGFG